MVEALVAAGAEVNHVDAYGPSALHDAPNGEVAAQLPCCLLGRVRETPRHLDAPAPRRPGTLLGVHRSPVVVRALIRAGTTLWDRVSPPLAYPL